MDILNIRCSACCKDIATLNKNNITPASVETILFECECGGRLMDFTLNGESVGFTSLQEYILPEGCDL